MSHKYLQHDKCPYQVLDQQAFSPSLFDYSLSVYLLTLNTKIFLSMQSTIYLEKPKQKNCQFIDKLIDMMEKYPNHIYWTQEGDELMITRLEEMEINILPEYFRHQNFASFVRQLNMYGFCKKEKCQQFLRFTHQIFKKNNNNQFYLIQRKAKIRNIRNSSCRFYESNNNLINVLKTESGLNEEAHSLTVTLLQYKDNIQDATKRIKYQLDKLLMEFKDIRSQPVREIVDFLEKESLPSVIGSLSKGKQIDQYLHKQFKNYKNECKNDVVQELEEQCSLQNNLESENLDSSNEQNDISNRFELQQDQLSAFNEFQHKKEIQHQE